jgi:hypothetical protein
MGSAPRLIHFERGWAWRQARGLVVTDTSGTEERLRAACPQGQRQEPEGAAPKGANRLRAAFYLLLVVARTKPALP